MLSRARRSVPSSGILRAKLSRARLVSLVPVVNHSKQDNGLLPDTVGTRVAKSVFFAGSCFGSRDDSPHEDHYQQPGKAETRS
jgi:hypothetical protein